MVASMKRRQLKLVPADMNEELFSLQLLLSYLLLAVTCGFVCLNDYALGTSTGKLSEPRVKSV